MYISANIGIIGIDFTFCPFKWENKLNISKNSSSFITKTILVNKRVLLDEYIWLDWNNYHVYINFFDSINCVGHFKKKMTFTYKNFLEINAW